MLCPAWYVYGFLSPIGSRWPPGLSFGYIVFPLVTAPDLGGVIPQVYYVLWLLCLFVSYVGFYLGLFSCICSWCDLELCLSSNTPSSWFGIFVLMSILLFLWPSVGYFSLQCALEWGLVFHILSCRGLVVTMSHVCCLLLYRICFACGGHSVICFLPLILTLVPLAVIDTLFLLVLGCCLPLLARIPVWQLFCLWFKFALRVSRFGTLFSDWCAGFYFISVLDMACYFVLWLF